AEGYYASRSIHKINEEYQVSMPISEAVYKILYEKAIPKKEMANLALIIS
ncbi:MAG: hypothetical protein PHS40_06975, partial [Mariniphaga sp.]|nr:hypothetical protein [Mariniphaga sp.]